MTESDVATRGMRKTKIGVVVSDKMDKSRVVAVTRRVKHPRYEKYVTRTSTFMCHDEANESRVGDKVLIVETRPLSRRKRWRLVEILEKAK